MQLIKPFSDAEIYAAAIQLGQWKSLGPVGLPMGFFVDQWKELGTNIVNPVKDKASSA